MTEYDEQVWRATGIVVRGKQLGRMIGYRTANVQLPSSAELPADGVYAGIVELETKLWRPAAISVGTNPTFNGNKRTLEAHLLDFDDDIYGMPVRIESWQRLRATTKFADVPTLVDAIAQDVAATRELVCRRMARGR